MKKILFVLAFAFIGQQAFSQMYMVMVSSISQSHPSGLADGSGDDAVITVIDPLGNTTFTHLSWELVRDDPSNAILIHQTLNNIMSLGYKLVGMNPQGDFRLNANQQNFDQTFFLAIPWTASGLEEVATTLNSLSISPNPANEFVNISLSYDLKGESEIVFISEAGYVYHKESIGSISKNETYNIDISRIPAGKYLVTIKNGKTYTTPQKLIIL